MSTAASLTDAAGEYTMTVGDVDAEVHETHTGLVVLVGDRAFKVKKPVTTDFLDFSTVERREEACQREVALNRRLSPDSYLGVGHFTDPDTGVAEPVIVMRRYPESARLSALVDNGQPVHEYLRAIASRIAEFHRGASRGAAIDACGDTGAVAKRWRANLDELQRHAGSLVDADTVRDVRRMADQFVAERAELFGQRITDGHIIDGHADLLADDIFCLPDDLAILDCLEFDDTLRCVDTIDDAAFLAMDLEFLGREDLGEYFLDTYRRRAADSAPKALSDFYIAYRAVVRAKVDCIRVTQGHPEASTSARRHIDIALKHLKSATLRLVIIGGGPGTGKSTLARALAEPLRAQVISTDDVRREMVAAGNITGVAGTYQAGLYAPANVAAVYDEVLRRADAALRGGTSVILDGTWHDPRRRDEARAIADHSTCPVVELTCSAPLQEAAARVQRRPTTTSDATPEIVAAMAERQAAVAGGHLIDTTRPLAESVREVLRICLLTT